MPLRATRIAQAAIAVLALTSCATSTLGDRLGVDISGRGANQVALTWDELHAWGPLLQQRGADLVAEYKTPATGLVREVLGNARPSGQRALSWALPPMLKAPHEGPVCLYVQVPATRNLLPVRKAQGAGFDTARFRFPGWESGLAAQSGLRSAKAELGAYERQVGAIDAALQSQSARLQQRGWGTAAACEAITPPSAAAVTPPLGVLPPEAHDSAVRQACVLRMVNSMRLRSGLIERAAQAKSEKAFAGLLNNASSLAGMGEAAAAVVMQFKPGTNAQANAVLAQRQREAQAFRDDWRAFAPRLGGDYYPAIGKPDDYLTLVDEAQRLHLKLILQDLGEPLGIAADKRPEVSANDRLAVAGSMLDTYKGCVADGRNELRNKLTAWTELQRDTPERNRRIREHFVAECRSQHEQLARTQTERTRATAELAQAQQRLAAAQAAAQQTPAVAGAPALLNGLTCQ